MIHALLTKLILTWQKDVNKNCGKICTNIPGASEKQSSTKFRNCIKQLVGYQNGRKIWALGQCLKRMVKRAHSPDAILYIEDPWYPLEFEVRKKFTTRTLGNVIMDLEDLKNGKPLAT